MGTSTAELVDQFYARVWNTWDDEAVDRVLAPDFVFRGSLGDRTHGRDGYRSYRDKIRRAFPDFHNEVIDLVADGERAAARLCFTGHHHGELWQLPATGRLVTYHGAAFFTARDGQLVSAWVLGDLDALRRQLRAS